jgi:hypothetical protein
MEWLVAQPCIRVIGAHRRTAISIDGALEGGQEAGAAQMVKATFQEPFTIQCRLGFPAKEQRISDIRVGRVALLPLGYGGQSKAITIEKIDFQKSKFPARKSQCLSLICLYP